jgi:hypothetical protein
MCDGALHGVPPDQLGEDQRVDDGAGVVAFEPAVGGDGAAAGAVGAGIHHDEAVAGAEQELRVADDADAVVGDAVEEEDPIAVGILRADFPATENCSIGSTNVEILAGGTGDRQGNVGFVDEVGSQLAADGMKECGAGEPSGYRREQRRQEQ